MKFNELTLAALMQGENSTLNIAGERALLLDATALGLLRRELIHVVGPTAARGVLTRFGYAHGFRTAGLLKNAYPWDSERDWRLAGSHLHFLQGMVRVEVPPWPPMLGPEPFAYSTWHDSYEAEQHLLHLGQSDEEICWTLCGFASGYMSASHGHDILCKEVACRGKGDPVCQVIGKPLAEWGDEADSLIAFYKSEVFESCLDVMVQKLKIVEKNLEKKQRELREFSALSEDHMQHGIVAKSLSMRKTLDLAKRVAKYDSTVLIQGESGTGKERVARLIHDESARSHGPYLAINCAAVAENLMEGELFGHAKGAFTGATQDRLGLFEAASKGTLFLDEVAELSLPLQARLLRVLQEHEVRRIGENFNRKIETRIIAATHKDLAVEVSEGRFRQDLLFRLNVFQLQIDPLRERQEDILPLIHHLMAVLSKKLGKSGMTLDCDAAQALIQSPWPGNIRELHNTIEYALVVCDEKRIQLSHLPSTIHQSPVSQAVPPPHPSTRRLEDVEKEHILQTLKQNGGNQTQTARDLGIGSATLYRKLKSYGRESTPSGTITRRGPPGTVQKS